MSNTSESIYLQATARSKSTAENQAYQHSAKILGKEIKRPLFDAVTRFYSYFAMAAILGVCLLILIVLWYYGHSAISLSFLTTAPAASASELAGSGILTPLIGTLLLTLIGMLVAFPFALATAIYLCFFVHSKGFSQWLQTAVDVLAGVPTIVIALFARAIFTHPSFGFLSTIIENGEGVAPMAFGKSFLVAGITMAIMILPFMIKAMMTALRSVPRSYMDASLALGATKLMTVIRVILPAGSAGLITGAVLGMGRIMGDTAIVWLTLGGTLRMTGMQPWYMPQNWLSTLQNTGSTLTSYIYYTSPAGEGNQYTVAFGASLVLMLMILSLNGIIALIGRKGR